MRTRTVLMFLSLFIWCPSALQQIAEKLEGPPQCAIIQDRQYISIPTPKSSFLKYHNGAQCQSSDQTMLKCGQTDVYIKPECVCSFYNVYEAEYHGYSSCPKGSGTDIVDKLKCPDCKNYSFNNTGPCINGGNLTCKGDEVAPNINCKCPPNYKGMFCEEKVENVTRICNRTSNPSALGLKNCTETGMDCVTYSRNMTYAYKCNKFHTSQERGELPLCIDTEDFNRYEIPAAGEVSSNKSSGSQTSGGISLTSVRWTVLIIVGSFCVFL
ncbi:uncharacterized protein LOC144626482 [Crassostrea virginica]